MHHFETLEHHELYETHGGHMPLTGITNALLLPALLGVGADVLSSISKVVRSVAGMF